MNNNNQTKLIDLKWIAVPALPINVFGLLMFFLNIKVEEITIFNVIGVFIGFMAVCVGFYCVINLGKK